jgi:hypothetical protein
LSFWNHELAFSAMTWQRALELASSVISLPYTLHLKPFAAYSYLYIY